MQQRHLKVVGGLVKKDEMSELIKTLKKLGHDEREIIQLLGIKTRGKKKNGRKHRC